METPGRQPCRAPAVLRASSRLQSRTLNALLLSLCLAFWFVTTHRYACASLEGHHWAPWSGSATPPGISARARTAVSWVHMFVSDGKHARRHICPSHQIGPPKAISGSRDSVRRPLTASTAEQALIIDNNTHRPCRHTAISRDSWTSASPFHDTIRSEPVSNRQCQTMGGHRGALGW